MDSFTEHLVKKVPTTQDNLKKFGSVLAGVLLLFVMCWLGMIFTYFTVILVALGIAAVIGGIYLSTMTKIEYEYCFVNGDLDVDKITAQRSRKRLVTAKCDRMEELHPYTEADKNIPCDAQIVACSSFQDPDTYTAVFTHKKHGKCVLYFTPSEKMLSQMRLFLPRELRAQMGQEQEQIQD